MCNPRRVCVNATEEIQAAWDRVVRRTVELSDCVSGEARIRQELDASVSSAALAALEHILDQGQDGWTAVPEGFRFDVEGGWVIYHVDDQSLEFVAIMQDIVQVTGDAEARLEGVLETAVTVEGEGRYYDDNWGNRTENDARRDAEADAKKKIDAARREQVRLAQEQAETAASDDIEAQARRRAEQHLAHEGAARRAELERQAAAHLETVGVRCRQEFNRVLALAYRDAVLAWARTNGGQDIQCNENGGVIEIEFMAER